MTNEKLYEVLGDINEKHIGEAHRTTAKSKKHAWVKWGAIAACLCLVVLVGAVHRISPGNSSNPVLEWSKGFQAADYFTYNEENENGVSSSASLDTSAIPYAAECYFSDEREQMETDGVIPEMTDYPLFDCIGRYNEDGSIYSVTFVWGLRGDTYSNLKITAGLQEVEMIEDCIGIEVDEDGNIVTPAVTVTERDGVSIVAEGNENRDKTLTFRNDTGWYQITGSWNDSYESVVQLLDWVWEHPVDFERFDMSRGVEYTYSTLDEYPDALADYIPDFSIIGYELGENSVGLKDGEPVYFEGHYYADGDGEQPEIHWCVDTEPDYYDQQESLGDISLLTEQIVTDTLSEESSFSFTIGDYFIKVYTKEAQAHEAWLLVEFLKLNIQ
jgi:hypothetical protein